MSDESTIVLGIFIGICVLGVACVLLRIAIERDRLLSRYTHIKAIMEYEQNMKALQQNAKNSVAGEADFISPEEAENATVVSPVGES